MSAIDELGWEFNGEDGKWRFVLDSIRGGLETYDGIVKWLAMHDSLDAAVVAAAKLRDGMVAS